MCHSEQPVGLVLLGGFQCAYLGNPVPLALGAQRLLALLALHPAGVHRVVAAERLWPAAEPDRAAANLRAALWRGKRIGEKLVIDPCAPRLRLAPTVGVDMHILLERLRDPSQPAWDDNERKDAVTGLTSTLLPDWSDDWLTFERERWNQTRVHHLERIAQQLLAQEHYFAALETALAAVALEPIRETAHRIIIETHLAEGNKATALQHYQRYRGLLQRELNVAPSPLLDELIRPLTWS
jgi:DNA-binding SARP family transcriptional activator